jgi:dolichyl-phosphate beta-glucosyltransferase
MPEHKAAGETSAASPRVAPGQKTGDEPETRAGIFLSIVIPAYNESKRIPATLRQVLDYAASLGKTWEVVVVDDGSTDDTASQVEEMGRKAPSVRVLRNMPNAGKGAAVRKGMLGARGERVLFTDADLSAPIAEAARLFEALDAGFDVAIGSRALRPEWIGVHQSGQREAAGKFFNFFTRLLTGLDYRDTQCGFKAFRREAAHTIFAAQRINGWGFDVEALYLARKFGFRTQEVAVHWNHCAASKIDPFGDGLRMAAEVLRIRWNDWRGRYEGEGNREQGTGNRKADPSSKTPRDDIVI